ncbi:hypothetical protein EV191_11942 [Tamaricihabitans halophyticus]|uniref:DUF4440 domain-containing protein n=1 Tax=Tamaricihabitans halophyticus TaxID=1262583 RepID=A0A4R2Q7M2_9PSEU|nr:hypothetical protein EV191_11942 [Tamaricihabitans halophyticus]
MTDLAEHVLAEVERQHARLARWLGTDCGSEVLDELRRSHLPQFEIITIDGHLLRVDQLFDGLAGAGNAAPGLRIDIDEIGIVAQTTDLVTVRFRETHSRAGDVSQRLVTAVLRKDAGAPHGLRWQYVHETAVRH